jgi:hypothetical protein
MVKMSSDNQISNGRTAQQEVKRKYRIITFNASQLIWMLFGLLEILIVTRIGLRLIGANPEIPFVSLIYSFTYLFLFPITGSIGSPTAGSVVFEISSFFAMMIYALIAAVVEKIVWLLLYHPPEPVNETKTTAGEHTITYSQTSKNE